MSFCRSVQDALRAARAIQRGGGLYEREVESRGRLAGLLQVRPGHVELAAVARKLRGVIRHAGGIRLLHRYPGDLRVEIADSPQIGHELAKDDAGALGPARPLFERESQWRVARGLRVWVNELPEVPEIGRASC